MVAERLGFARAEALTFGRAVAGLNAYSKGVSLGVFEPISPESVERYLAGKFGDRLEDARAAMRRLARSLPPAALARHGYELYERFRPEIPQGRRGWGAKGALDLERVAALAREAGSADNNRRSARRS